MSRVIEQIASVQFQVNARQANAAMQALQEASNDLNRAIDSVNRNIANLGKDVPKDNPQLLNYQNQLEGLQKDLKDVEKAQRDFLKGAKAADQLWKAAQEQNIEGLSFRSIKAGINGLKKRQEGLSPGDAQDMKDWRIIKEVIDEADRVMKQAGADVQNVVQTIRDGGKVSEQAMRQTINTLKELKGSVDETDAEYRTYGSDLDFMEAKLKDFNEAQRRAKGEIVDANDARREMNKLTAEGAAAAKREAEEADRLVQQYKAEGEELARKRGEIKANIEATQQQIDENHKLIEEKHRELEANERAHIIIQDANHAHIEGLKTRAEQERKLANEKSDAAETHRRAAELQKQTTEQLTEKVTELQGKLAEMNAEPVKPKVDTTDIDALKAKLETLAAEKKQLEGKMSDFKFDEDMLASFDKELDKRTQKVLEQIESLPKTNVGGRVIVQGNKPFSKKIMSTSKNQDFNYEFERAKFDLNEFKSNVEYHEGIIDDSDKERALAYWKKQYEAIRDAVKEGKRLLEIDSNKSNPDTARELQRRLELAEKLKASYKEVYDMLRQYGNKISEQWGDDIYEERVSLNAKEKEQTQKRLNEIDQESIGIQKQLNEQIAQAEQQGVQSTDKLTEAQNLYNQKLQERIQKEQELETIKNRSWQDDPEVKRLDAEIAKLEELIAVSEKYKKQFAKMSDAKFEEDYMGGDKEVQAALHIGSDPRKSIWGAADYLKGAYNDRSRASLLDYVKEHANQAGGEERVAEYQQAADRVAKGIVQNAQENFRRAIYREIQDGNWTSEAMEEQLDTFRSQFQNEFRNAKPGQLKDDPEYHYYKYIIEQMEKYIEVAKKVEAERAKIAGGEEYVELAKHKDDIDQPHKGLLRQKEERDWDRATIKTEDIDRRRKDEEYTKSQEVEQAKRNETEAERQLNEEKAKGTQATKSETEAIQKKNRELERTKAYIELEKDNISRNQQYYDQAIKDLKEMGLAEKDITDQAKIQEAIEKKTLEIMEAEVNAGKEAAEQRRELVSKITSSQLGGSKADQDFYAKHAGEYELSQYKDTDEIMERIAHLEMVSKLKNGKRFSDDTNWDPDDEVDEDELYVMTDEEKEAALNELRILKQHIREELLKTLNLEGNIDNAVLEMTGGDGFSEDAQFGKQLNDKLQSIKEKIDEKIQTSLDKYDDIVNMEYSEAWDDNGKLDKEKVRRNVAEYIEDTVQEASGSMANIDESRESIEEYEKDIVRLNGEIEKLNQTEEQSNQQTEEELRLKGELETAQGKLAESKKRDKEEQEKYVKLQAEAIEQGNKAAEAETKLADAQSDATQKQVEFNQKQQEGLDSINQMAQGNQALQESIDGLNGELEQNSKDTADNANKATEAEQQKQQAQQLSIKRMEEMLAKLKEEYYTEELTAEKREEHKQKIKELDEALRLAKGEWMSYGDAMKYANSIGSDGFMATDEQTKMATDALTRHREELIKTIQQKEADSQATSAERAELEQLDQALTKIKTGFTGADEVMTRWAEHMNAGKTASENVAQILDDKLNAATSSFDDNIKDATERFKEYEKAVTEGTEKLDKMEKELAELEQKHANSSWLRKQTGAYRRESERIWDLRDAIGEEETYSDGMKFRYGIKGDLSRNKEDLQWWKEQIEYYKQLKAEELGITEESVASEQKKQDAKRLTNEQMQEGIKLLEEEYAKTGHTTEDGIKKRQQLRDTIDQMNQELKESTGEWMKLADAEKLAEQAGKDTFLNKEGKGFIASPEEIQKATQALERRRDALIKNMKTSGEATKEQERELADLTKKIKDLKFEQDNLNMSQEKMQMLMRTPTNAVSLDELRAAIKRADAELKRMEDSLGQNNDKYKAFAEQVRNAKNQLKEMEGQAKASATAWEKAWSRLKTYVVMYMGFNAVWQKMMGTADDLMQLSDKMGEVRKTTGFTADEVGRLSDELKKLDTRTTITGLLDLSVAAGQLGLKTQEDVEGFTIAANKLMVALPEMGKEGATEMLKVALATGEIDKIRRKMEQGLIDGSSATAVAMEKVGSTIDRLRATSAATAPAITDFVKRVGAVGAQSGISIDQVAALGSTVDALGMRVEMSATALSRMIPAIKNNAFDVAKAIGVTPNTLRDLFEAGRGMEAVLLIFQKIKDSGMGADDIDKMLGMGNMKEVMKELNQQGARAGIVFAGLSQNVDTLREHLNTASKAYEENIAIQQEYDKMNETTAARWERLKNVVEELFVGDALQRWLGGIIDGLRTALDVVVDLIDYVKAFGYSFAAWKLGVGGAIWAYLINPLRLAITETHSLGTQIKRVAATWRTAWRSMDAATKANLIMAIGTAVYYLGKAVWDTCTKVSELAKAMAEVDEQEVVAIRDINRLSKSLTDAIPKANGLANNHKNLKEETDALRKEVDELKKSTDKSAEAHGKLSRKTEELEKKEKYLKAAEDESNKANKERSSLITEINSKYSTYLGYMLNEETAALQVAQAHRQIVAALKEEMEQKRMNRQQEAINAKYDEKIAGYQTDAQDELSNLPADIQRRIMNRFNSVLANITFEIDPNTQKGIFRRSAAEGFGEKVYREREGVDNASYASFELMQPILKELIKQEAIGQQGVTLTTKELDEYVKDAWGLIGVDAGFWQLSLNSLEKERQTMELRNQSDQTQKALHATSVSEADKANIYAYMKIKDITGGLAENQELSSENVKSLAQQVNIITGNLSKFKDELKNADSYIGKDNDATLENAVNTMFAALSEKQRKQILNAAKRSSKVGTDTGGGAGGGGGTNPWGGNAPAESTDYATWDVNELVARRNQIDKFKNVLKPDTDIRAVLAEDKALMKALDNGLKEDWKSVLGWYNTERKKIQEELKSERFSTNEGHWRDEKKGRSRKNHFRESDYALAELDRYYSKRKEELEKARIEENMSEELFNRQAELLEQEHLERRSKLRETFTAGNTKEEKEMVKQFRDWWSKLEKDGKLDEVPWATVESEWAKALASEIGRNNLKAQQDLTQMQQITVKHLNKIADIIAKERPYDGIVDNLRKNLTEMDILFADMEKKGITDAGTLVKAEAERMRFLLGEAENAYALTFEDLEKKMREKGMGAWADELMVDDQKKQSIIEALHKVYDDVQNAIKKEAAQIKKNVDIMWQDVMPGKNMSLKDSYEMGISRLGLQEENVSRANSLIGAGQASERVADKLAIKQLQLKITMQEHYYNLMEQEGRKRIAFLNREAELEKNKAEELKKESEELRKQGKLEEAQLKARLAEDAVTKSTEASLDAQHLTTSLNISQAKELTEIEKQRNEIIARTEETQNRLYRELREWGSLLTSSMQSVFEASHAGDAEYYNERAKMNLTGKGGPGAGMYIVIDNEGTSDATAHYEYLDERQALERQHQIEIQNAQADAWKKVFDDFNQKMNDTITDQLNAMWQNKAINDNTDALGANTRAMGNLTEAIGNGLNVNVKTPAAPVVGTPAADSGKGGDTGGTQEFFPQALKVEVDTVQAVKDLTSIPGVSMDDNTLTLKFDTTEAVKQFQRLNKLKPDGIVGPKTMAKLNEHGIAKATEAKYEVDGKTIGFDDEQAVREFQKQHGITQTGAVGEKTMAKLEELGAKKVQDMTFTVSLKDEKAMDYVKELNTFKLADKTVNVKVNDQAAMDTVNGMQNLVIKDKQFVVTAKMKKEGDISQDDIEKAFPKQTPSDSTQGGGVIPERKEKYDPADSDSWSYAQRKREGLPADSGQQPDAMPVQLIPEVNSEVSGELQRNTETMKELTQALHDSAEEKKQKEEFEDPYYDEEDPDTWGYAERKRAGYRVDDAEPDAMPLSPEEAALKGEEELNLDQANTDATLQNTEALTANTQALAAQGGGGDGGSELSDAAQKAINESNIVTQTKIDNKKKETSEVQKDDKKQQQSSSSMFAKMTQAANLYGVAYQAMSNDNLDTAQKFQMIALQAVGNAAIAGLQVAMSSGTAETATQMPAAAAKSTAQAGPIAGPILFAILSALVGGLMGLAASKVAKSKSQISQVTGASMGAGRLSTGMMTYAEGNVNEFSDPASLTPGKTYNVDAADGRTYRAKYTGTNPRTHITTGPEFHLAGEKGREMIIDAGTTRQITMNDNEIWRAIKTLSGGGRIASRRSIGHGMHAFADGNVDDFEDVMSGSADSGMGGFDPDMLAGFQNSLDRNSEVMEQIAQNGIKAYFDVYGKGGLVDSYDTGKKTVQRHGERY